MEKTRRVSCFASPKMVFEYLMEDAGLGSMRKREVVCGSAIEQKFRGSGSAEKETILSTQLAGAK